MWYSISDWNEKSNPVTLKGNAIIKLIVVVSRPPNPTKFVEGIQFFKFK